MKQERTFTFGKYKGQEIKYIILTDIGYIVWCLENFRRFKLTDEEQAIYDAVAIRIRKSNWQYLITFSIGLMYNHIKNRDAFEKLETPFIENFAYIAFKESEKDNPVCKSIEKYVTSKTHRSNIAGGFSAGDFVVYSIENFDESEHEL